MARVSLSLLLVLALGGCDGALTNSNAARTDSGQPSTIGAVQGTSVRSPYEGQTVRVQGVVTGNFTNGLEGFFLQDATGAEDRDPQTSDGIFVQWKRDPKIRVRRGDRVELLGRVVELGEGDATQTALADVEVEVLGRGGVHAATLKTAPSTLAEWERYEGMWLRIDAPLTVISHYGLQRFGELDVAFGERLYAPTEVAPPGPQARTIADENRRRTLRLDDNRRGEFPDKIWYLPAPLSADQPLRTGSTLHGVEGVLEQARGQWRLQITAKLDGTDARIEQAPRPAPPTVAGDLRFGAFNLHNLFNGEGNGRGFPTERGASSRAEYERQRDKLVAVISGLKPDIAAFGEMENDGHGERSAERDLLRTLNAALGEDGDYRAIELADGQAGDDAIRVAMFYRSRRVSPVGKPATLTTGPFAGGSRPPLAQTFEAVVGGPTVTVVANHFKSKGGCEEVAADDAGNRDTGDGQGCWNALRVESARELDAWLKSNPTGNGSGRVVLLGDFNAYAEEDPIRLLKSLGWLDAFDVAGSARDAYSFVYAGLSGRLDHALVSPEFAPAVAGAAEWHTNSDENELFDYNAEHKPAGFPQPDPWRASDHDPLLIGVDFKRTAN